MLKAKIGRDTVLNGDLRLRASDNHQVVYFETEDAGALFRFTDMYPRMFGGQMWVAMDPPTQDQAPQVGTLNIRNFVVRGEPALDRVVAGAPGEKHGSVQFSELRSEFTRFPGRMAVRDGIVRGPLVGVTVEGQVDYAKELNTSAWHVCAVLRPQQYVRAIADRRVLPRWRRQQRQRGAARHYL